MTSAARTALRRFTRPGSCSCHPCPERPTGGIVGGREVSPGGARPVGCTRGRPQGVRHRDRVRRRAARGSRREPGARVVDAHQRLRRAPQGRLGLRGRVARARRPRVRPRGRQAPRDRDAPRQHRAHQRRPLLRRPRAPRVLDARVHRRARARRRRQGRRARSSPGRCAPRSACSSPARRSSSTRTTPTARATATARTRTTSSTARCRSRASCATCCRGSSPARCSPARGKIGSENGAAAVDFQISQRADFFEEEVGLETTLKRPIVNTRDEPHADPQLYRRLHVIVGDANLCEVATFLKVGTTAIVLAMIEDDFIDTASGYGARKDFSIVAPVPVDADRLARPDVPRDDRAPRRRHADRGRAAVGVPPARPQVRRRDRARALRRRGGRQPRPRPLGVGARRARARPADARRSARLGDQARSSSGPTSSATASTGTTRSSPSSTSSTTTCGPSARSTSASCGRARSSASSTRTRSTGP